MIDNNVVVVSYSQYDRIEMVNPKIRNAIIEVRENTILLNKEKIHKSAQELCKEKCNNSTNFNAKCKNCKLARQTKKLLS